MATVLTYKVMYDYDIFSPYISCSSLCVSNGLAKAYPLKDFDALGNECIVSGLRHPCFLEIRKNRLYFREHTKHRFVPNIGHYVQLLVLNFGNTLFEKTNKKIEYGHNELSLISEESMPFILKGYLDNVMRNPPMLDIRKEWLAEEVTTDDKSFFSKVDQLFLFLLSSISLIFTIVASFPNASLKINELLPVLFVGFIMPLYVGYIRGSMMNLFHERLRGWLFFFVGTFLYIYLISSPFITSNIIAFITSNIIAYYVQYLSFIIFFLIMIGYVSICVMLLTKSPIFISKMFGINKMNQWLKIALSITVMTGVAMYFMLFYGLDNVDINNRLINVCGFFFYLILEYFIEKFPARFGLLG